MFLTRPLSLRPLLKLSHRRLATLQLVRKQPVRALLIDRALKTQRERCFTHQGTLIIRHYSSNLTGESDKKNDSTPKATTESLVNKKDIPTQVTTTPASSPPSSNILQRIRRLLKPTQRPFTVDDFSALFSWLMISNIVLIILGTTTFASLLIFLMNTVFAQELVATSLGNFITRNSGLRVVFESAIVPDWRGGVISFNRCFVSRRPKKKVKGNKKAMKAIAATATASLVDETEKKKQEVASAKTTTTAVSDVGFRKGNINDAIASIEKNEEVEDDDEEYEDDGNYTQFDLTIDQVNVSLSLGKFLNGKGILNEVEIVGMRGVVDRSFVHWDPNDDARNYKNVYKPGDFEIDNFKMSDVLFKLIQPNGFRPFNVSIYNCDLPIFRKNWLLLDFLNANSISGSYDDSLFTIHKRHVTEYGPDGSEKLRRVTTCRVDALNVDHLNTGLEGPFGWITSGEVDMIGDIRIPQEDETINVGEIIQSISEKLSKDSLPASRIRSSSSSSSSHTTSSSSTTTHPTSANSMNFTDRRFILDLRINLNKVKAAVPIFTDDLSYVNNALIRPIVGYINSRKTYIPIRCTITKDISDFDGSWTVYDSLLMDDISVQVYDAFVEYVANEEKRVERLKRVGFWSLQLVFQVLLMSLGLIA